MVKLFSFVLCSVLASPLGFSSIKSLEKDKEFFTRYTKKKFAVNNYKLGSHPVEEFETLTKRVSISLMFGKKEYSRFFNHLVFKIYNKKTKNVKIVKKFYVPFPYEVKCMTEDLLVLSSSRHMHLYYFDLNNGQLVKENLFTSL